VLGAELAAAEDTDADGVAELAADAVAELAAVAELTADGVMALAAALVSEAVVDGLFDADATAMMTRAPNAMSPVSTLCLAGQDLRFRPFGVCGGMAGCCCHGGGWGAPC
jgi:hypothetical protein